MTALEQPPTLRRVELQDVLDSIGARPVPYCEVQRGAVDLYWAMVDRAPQFTPEEVWQAVAARARHEAHRAQVAVALGHEHDAVTFARTAHVLRTIARYSELQTTPPEGAAP